jgi:hypothetical protein
MSPKIIDRMGREDKFDRKIIEKDLKAYGMPDCVAESISVIVEDRVKDGWTTRQIWQETDIELNRIKEDVQKAHVAFNQSGSKFGSSTRSEPRPKRPAEQPLYPTP